MSADHDSVVDDWRRNAEAHDEPNFAYLRSLKFADDPNATDRLAARLHREAFRIVDCTRCANCCRTMDVRLNSSDIERIAGRLEMTADEFTAKYVHRVEGEEFEIASKPCPFLGADNRCAIYEFRPDCCREYPHTDKPEFATRTYLHSQNALVCPAVFWIAEQMRRSSVRQ